MSSDVQAHVVILVVLEDRSSARIRRILLVVSLIMFVYKYVRHGLP